MSKTIKIAGVDMGNESLKIKFGPNEEFKLKNAVKSVYEAHERKDLGFDNSNREIMDDLDVLIKSENVNGRFFVGPLAIKQGEDEVAPGTTKLQNDKLIVPLLTMLALNVTDERKVASFAVGCGLPIREFKDKDAFSKKILGTYQIQFMSGAMKGRELTITLSDAWVIPEGVGVIMNQALNDAATAYRNKDLLTRPCAVADIGAFTIDIAVLVGGKPDSDASQGIEEGIANYLDNVVEHINGTYNIKMSRAQLVDRLEHKDFVISIMGKKHDIKRLIDQQFSILAGKVVSHIRSIWQRHYDIEVFYIAGGGAKALEQYLKAEMAKQEVNLTFLENEDPQMQNASGNWKYAKTKIGAKK